MFVAEVRRGIPWHNSVKRCLSENLRRIYPIQVIMPSQLGKAGRDFEFYLQFPLH